MTDAHHAIAPPPSSGRPTDGTQDFGRRTPHSRGRRGILAAAGVALAGLLAKQTAQPVRASTAMQIANTPGFVNNAIVDQSSLGGAIPEGRTVLVADTRPSTGNAYGFYGYGAGNLAGVGGTGGVSGGAGVSGTGGTNFGAGVVGVAGRATNPGAGVGVGVMGTGRGANLTGVFGVSDGNYGVYGVSDTYFAVVGLANAPAGSGVAGVFGTVANGGNYGVWGQGSGGVGVYGSSTSGSGVVGSTTSNTPGTAGGYFYTTTSGGSGVVGQVFASSGAAAFVGAAAAPNYAAFFTGTVVVNGKLVVSDPSYKSGALQHPDGSHRLVYCVESPESWIEDVGTGTLSSGKATITFDNDFTAVTHTDTYHVFLTEYDAPNHLYVTDRTATGFTVRAEKAGASSTFSWKVMVKAKSSVKSERLGKFVMPSIKLADQPPHLPDLPTPLGPPK